MAYRTELAGAIGMAGLGGTSLLLRAQALKALHRQSVP